jgi:hypothetical protein
MFLFGDDYMPFGFERKLQEEYKEEFINNQVDQDLEPIGVNCRLTKDGKYIPMEIIIDDKEIPIRVISSTPCITLKLSRSGMRYKCRYGIKDFYIYQIERKWYLKKS